MLFFHRKLDNFESFGQFEWLDQVVELLLSSEHVLQTGCPATECPTNNSMPLGLRFLYDKLFPAVAISFCSYHSGHLVILCDF